MQRIDFMMQRNDFVAKRPERQEISRLVLSLLNKKSIDTKSKLGKPRFEQKYCFLGHQSGIHLTIKIRMKNTIKQKMRPHRMKQECCWKGVSKNFSIRYRRKNPSWYSLLVHNLQWKIRKHDHWVFVNRSRGAKKILIFNNKHVSSSWNFGLGVLNAAWMSGHSSIRTCNPVVPRPRPAISCLLRDQNPWPSLPPANCLGFLNFAMFCFVSFKLLE